MAGSITHKFVSAKADGADATVVRPSNWNDTHNFSGIVTSVNGQTPDGTGAVTISSGAAWGGITGTLSSQTDLQTALDGKQATLVSGTNIKTVNGSSLLGSGDLTVSGGSGLIDYASPITISNTATTLTIGKHHVITETGADRTMTLPAASGNAGKGISIQIAASTTKLVTIDGNASETIDGALTRIMWAGEEATLLCDGSNWFKIAGKTIPMTMQMYLGTSQTGVVANGFRKVLYASIDYNNGFGDDIANNQMLIKRTGSYIVSMTHTISRDTSSGVAGYNHMFITQDNDTSTGIVFKMALPIPTQLGQNPTYVATRTVALTAGKTLNAYYYHDFNANIIILGSGIFQVALSATEVPSW